MRHPIRSAFGAGALALLLLAGCGDDEGTAADATTTTEVTSTTTAAARRVDVGVGEDGSTQTLAVGDELAILLEVNGGTGYSWELLVEPDPAVAEVVSTTSDTTTPTVPDDPPLVGRSETTTALLRATAPGTTTVRLGLVGPSGGDPEETVEYTVVVDDAG